MEYCEGDAETDAMGVVGWEASETAWAAPREEAQK